MVISGNVEPDYVKKLDEIKVRETRSRSTLINMAVVEYVDKYFRKDIEANS